MAIARRVLTGSLSMISSQKKARKASVTREEVVFRIHWLELALIASGLALFFQLFPSVWSSVVSFSWHILGYVDVRGWTWHSYAFANIAVLLALVGMRVWQDNNWNNR